MRFSVLFLLSCPPGKSPPEIYDDGQVMQCGCEAE